MPATIGSDANPVGFGYLHIPAINSRGYLAVRTFYTPALRTTVVDERDLIIAAGHSRRDIESTQFLSNFDSSTFTFRANHKLKRSFDVAITGILLDGKAYTHPLLLPFCGSASIQALATSDPTFIPECERLALMAIHHHQEEAYRQLRTDLASLPTLYQNLPYHEYIHQNTPVLALRQDTERLLWHHRLGHPSDYYLFAAHRYVKGVPRFKHMDPILDSCPTCIRSKQTKNPSGPNTTRTATIPFQGLSIDFSFAGLRSQNTDRSSDFVGFNGETCWILISDHFSRLKIGDTRLSKAAPLAWLRRFLQQHAPQCPDKYVHLDQGGELYANPQVRELFTEFGYSIFPTGADASHQNGPVERGHLTVANAVRSLLTGANLDIRFWPYAFHHWLRIDNSLPSRDQTATPLKIALDKVDDFSGFRTFGCRVWVRPPGRRGAKFRPNSRKGIFLGFLPHTTRNILWFDPETNRVKIATHARFDEGMNDLPLSDLPPNVVHLQRTQDGTPFPAEAVDSSISDFDIGSSPFMTLLPKTLSVSCQRPAFGFIIDSDDLNNRGFVSNILPNSSASRLFSSHKATLRKIRGAYIVRINDTPVFTAADIRNCLRSLSDAKAGSLDIVFAPEQRMSSKQLLRAARELNIYAPPSPDDLLSHVHSITVSDLRAISAVRFPDLAFDDLSIPLSDFHVAVNAIRSPATTSAEQALGHFTRRKLKRLDTWHLWHAGEIKQLDQFHALGMFGAPVPRPSHAIVLRLHWQYHIKRDGTRRARNCCDGSPRAAPGLHKLVQTYSSCVEQPIQRLFFALCSHLNYLVFGGDAKDAFAHSPPPDVPTFVSIDDAYAEWYEYRFGHPIDRTLVLPVQHALQGHPESGKLWERHITAILQSPTLNFTTTTHDKSIYRGSFQGTPILLLRQVDDFSLGCPSENIAKAIYQHIGLELQLPGESEPPFTYLGLVSDFNGVDVGQYDDRILLSCSSYIDRVLRSHGWSTPSASDSSPADLPPHTAPLPPDIIPALYAASGPSEDSPEHQRLVDKYGFTFRGLLGEILYAYVTCRPDIGYAVITLSKFASCPADFHFAMLKKVAKYLRRTRAWGIHYRRSALNPSLPPCPVSSFDLSDTGNFGAFPCLESGPSLTCFLDAAHANDLRKRRSTTGFAFMLSGGCISYKCKTQTTTATSSTEAEFYASVSAAKHARYLRSVLSELGFPQLAPTPLYCDNQSAIKMVNARIPTDRSRHILIQHFAIQDWKDAGDIVMKHIPGTLNPSDDLTKPLGWVLHSRHARRLMGHFAT